MKVDLVKGQKIELTKGTSRKRMRFGVGWDVNKFDKNDSFDIDELAFLLDGNGKAVDLIYWGNKNRADGCVVYSGDNLTGEGDGDDETMEIFFDKIPANVEKIAICVAIYQADSRAQNFGMISNAYVRGYDEDGEAFNYDLDEDYSDKTAIIAGEVYRHNGEWKFAAIGQGMTGWLPALAQYYGAEV